ncbi:MAG: aldehyde ferredoxin oxidoreductase family protein [Candidatus Odinarchaeota archaeon]
MEEPKMIANQYAIVNLSKGSVKISETPTNVIRNYLGGRGTNVYYLNKLLRKNIDPLSPENVLIFGAGLLTGYLIPNASRFNVTAKSPESGFLGDTNCGGYFGPEMRYAGFDRIIVLGKAKRPSYIFLQDGSVEIRDASDYWGLDTYEVQIELRKDLGDVQAAVTGVAGEKLVRFANIRNGVKNAGGRGGLGAVMGSKNLKALVAYGTQGLKVAHPEQLLELTKRINDYVLNSKVISVMGKLGSPYLYDVSNALGAIRTKNSQLNAWSDSLNAEYFEEYVEKMVSCASCIVHCRHRNTMNGEGPEYTTIGLLGANVGISEPKQVIELNNLCNRLGLDTASAGSILAWVFELYEKEIVDREKFQGEKLEFENFELVKSLLEKTAHREGLGDVLAESSQAVKYFGQKSADYLIAVKNLPQSDPHDVRYIKAFALGIATASRGADHLRSRPTLEIFLRLPQEVKENIYGKGISPDPTSYEGKEKPVFWSDNMYAVIDSVGICKFICHGFNSPHLIGYEQVMEFLHAAVDLKFDNKELKEVGQRIIDTERIINLRFGLTRADDSLPKRYFDDPAPLKTAEGHHVDRKQFQTMLDRYYVLRGWNAEGMLSEKRVNELEAIE